MSRPVAWIGADPGMSGAIAVHSFEADCLPVIEVVDMPTIEVDGKRTMDHWALAALLSAWARVYEIRNAAIERVHAIPNYRKKGGGMQGISSSASFNFGEGFGALKQAVASAGLPMTLISPGTWKAIYGLRGGKENKDMSRQKASQLFPAYSHLWARKKDDGRAEAVLLAHYASRLQEGK